MVVLGQNSRKGAVQAMNDPVAIRWSGQAYLLLCNICI
jgi:hypothetical protein